MTLSKRSTTCDSWYASIRSCPRCEGRRRPCRRIWTRRSPPRADAAKYGELIQADFNYFRAAEQFEGRVEQSEQLQQLDEELKENHVDLLKRFYRLFESMHRFVTDLTAYIGDLEDGVFIQQSLETVFLDTEGKQLLVCLILKKHLGA